MALVGGWKGVQGACASSSMIRYLADPILLPLAIAGSGSCVTLPLSRHSTTHIELVRWFLDVSVSVGRLDGDRCAVRVSFIGWGKRKPGPMHRPIPVEYSTIAINPYRRRRSIAKPPRASSESVAGSGMAQ
jgi:hypothetical protein